MDSVCVTNPAATVCGPVSYRYTLNMFYIDQSKVYHDTIIQCFIVQA